MAADGQPTVNAGGCDAKPSKEPQRIALVEMTVRSVHLKTAKNGDESHVTP